MTGDADVRWRTGNREVDEWTDSQHSNGKHSPNCPDDCRAARVRRPVNGSQINGSTMRAARPGATQTKQPVNGGAAGRRVRTFELTPASAIRPRPVTWAWRPDGLGRIPAGVITLGVGREGTGKSSFAAWQAAQITRGTLPGAFEGVRRNVIYLATEDAWEFTITPRLMAAGSDLRRVFRLDVYEDGQEAALTLPVDNQALADAIGEVSAALVIFDPLLSTISEKINTDRERELRRALDPLAALAASTGTGMFGIAHFNKAAGADVLSRITGSGAFKHVARAVLAFAEDDDTRVMSQVKNSLGRIDLPNLAYRMEPTSVDTDEGPAETVRFVFVGESDRSVRDVLSNGEARDEEHTVTSECAAWLRDYLERNGGQCKASDAIKEARADGFSSSAVTRARQRLKVRSMKGGMSGGWYWTLER